jgi:HSP20 family protein
MRLRYRTVLFHIEDGEDLRQHYQQLVDELMRQAQGSRAVARHAGGWRPPTDIHETPEAYVVKMEIAGMAEDAIEVTLYEDAVVVSGTRDNETMPEEGTTFHEAQIRYGPFQAAIPLPTPILREGAEARYHNGFLRLRLRKKPPERLKVQIGTPIDIQASPALASSLPEIDPSPAKETDDPTLNGGSAHE